MMLFGMNERCAPRFSRGASARVAVPAALLLSVGSAAHAATVLKPPFRSGTYYEQNAIEVCDGTNICSITFSTVPAGKKLTIQAVACGVRTFREPLQSLTLGVFRSAGESFERQHPLTATQLSVDGSSIHYTARTEMAFPVVGSAPRIIAFSAVPLDANEIGLVCQISGQLTP